MPPPPREPEPEPEQAAAGGFEMVDGDPRQAPLAAKLTEFGCPGAEGLAQQILTGNYLKMKKKGRLTVKYKDQIRECACPAVSRKCRL